MTTPSARRRRCTHTCIVAAGDWHGKKYREEHVREGEEEGTGDGVRYRCAEGMTQSQDEMAVAG